MVLEAEKFKMERLHRRGPSGCIIPWWKLQWQESLQVQTHPFIRNSLAR